MDNYATDRLNDVESVADEAVIADSVAEPLDKPVIENTKKKTTVKKSKEEPKVCEVLYWNKYSRNFAFRYEGKSVQITLPYPMEKCGNTVNVLYKDGNYHII